MAGSPLIVGRRVIVSPGGDKGRSLWAYDLETGEPAWHAGDDSASYTSPLLTTLASQQQVLILTAKSLAAHDPADGRQLWRHEWRPDQVIKCAQPLPLADFGYAAGQDQVLISSGYTVGSELLQVTHEEGRWDVRPLWSTRQLRAKFSNMLVLGNFVYGLDEGILVCLDLRDGSRRWKQGRYGHGQMLLVDELLLIQAESGEVVLVEPTPKGPRELGRLAALTDKTWNHAALASPYLLVRNDREAACYELPLSP
jgi:outer membrane protein assembly factor BamB